MKKYTLLITMSFLLCFLTTFKTTYAQWEGVYCPMDTTQPINLTKIYFVNQSTGFGISYSLSLYKTIDTGSTWNYINTPPNLSDIVFLNNNTGFIIGEHGISKTTNQGNTWTNLNVNFDSVMFIDFPSNNIGYTISAKGILAKTIDSGNNWNIIDTLNIEPRFSADFSNENIGFICSDSTIRKTDNGGLSWTQQIVTHPLQVAYLGVSNICFPSDSIGYCSAPEGTFSPDSMLIYKTIDAGTNWFLKSIVYAPNCFGQLTFTNDTIGYFSGIFRIKNTIDGGATWQNQYSDCNSNSFFDNIYDIFFLDEAHGFIAGWASGNEFYKTKNGGGVISNIITLENYKANLKVYPNPTSGLFSIEYMQNKKATINIYNISGQLIHSETLAGNTTKQIDLSNYSKGVYLIKIYNAEMIEIQKLVIE